MEVSLAQGACQAGAVMGIDMGAAGGLSEDVRQAHEECRGGQGQNISTEDLEAYGLSRRFKQGGSML